MPGRTLQRSHLTVRSRSLAEGAGEINPGQDRDTQRQHAVQHQPPPGGRIVAATVDEDNQKEFDCRQHPEHGGRSPAARPTGPPGAQTLVATDSVGEFSQDVQVAKVARCFFDEMPKNPAQ